MDARRTVKIKHRQMRETLGDPTAEVGEHTFYSIYAVDGVPAEVPDVDVLARFGRTLVRPFVYRIRYEDLEP